VSWLKLGIFTAIGLAIEWFATSARRQGHVQGFSADLARLYRIACFIIKALSPTCSSLPETVAFMAASRGKPNCPFYFSGLLASGYKVNKFSWLEDATLSDLVASDESTVWIGIFSNIVTERTRRRYASTEPENRLVARTLEGDWEEASRWERTTVWAILRNPAYKGTASLGRPRLRRVSASHGRFACAAGSGRATVLTESGLGRNGSRMQSLSSLTRIPSHGRRNC
jgi:hypothetical protein